MRKLIIILALFTGLTACTDSAPRGGGDILVLGDSIMAWNGSAAIPDVIANQTGRSVTSRAVPGAQFDNSSTIASAVGFDIQKQFPGRRWHWVVVNGGA